MRIVMMIGSLAMIGSGIFCFANGSAAFISVAFIIGAVFAVMGIIELVIGRRADFNTMGRGVSLAADGVIMLAFGLVIIAGQITDDNTARMLFALWLLIEGILTVGDMLIDSERKSSMDTADTVLGFAMAAISIYAFFSTRLFDINAIQLIGTAVLLLGLRRIKLSFDIEYTRPRFLTGSEERLEEALAEEKRALAKAKEGIREQKAAQRRIEKIRSDMAQEKNVLNDAKTRRELAERERSKEAE